MYSICRFLLTAVSGSVPERAVWKKQAMAVSARALARSVCFMGEPMMIVILVDHTGWVRYTWREEGGERRVERGGWREEGGEMGQGGLILLSSSLYMYMYMYLHEWGELFLHQQYTVHSLKQTQTNITTNTNKHYNKHHNKLHRGALLLQHHCIYCM